MSEAQRLNDILLSEAPALYRCLSDLGLDAAMPKGIPVQAAAARDTEINATIGQVTDGYGHALPLDFMTRWVDGLDIPKSFLYSPIDGHHDLREKWLERQVRLGKTELSPALPVTTHGLTHGLSILGDLFIDEDTDVIIADPYWENYHLVFTIHYGARLRTFPFFREGGFNVQGLADALTESAGRKTIVVLNLPGNPTGYTPTEDEVSQIVRTLTSHPGPLGVICDDAYQGTVWEPGRMSRSIYWDLAEQADPERLFVFKVDGATKELFFFPSRVGFLTHTVDGEGATALLSKLKGVIRGTVGCPPGPSQAMVLKALEDPGLDDAIADRLGVLRERYQTLRAALSEADDALKPYPFNSAYFALIGFDKGVSADAVRKRLIKDHSVGTIYVPSVNALRIAYCSLDKKQIPELIRRFEKAVSV